jgi:hypothetical protein
MAFNSYVVLDGYRYKTLAKGWTPATARPATPRLTLLGEMEATFGAGALAKWEGLIAVPHGETTILPADGTLYGSIYTLRATVRKCQVVPFTDHNGTLYSEAVLIGPFDEQTLINIWNNPSNKYYVRLQITAKAQ